MPLFTWVCVVFILFPMCPVMLVLFDGDNDVKVVSSGFVVTVGLKKGVDVEPNENDNADDTWF